MDDHVITTGIAVLYCVALLDIIRKKWPTWDPGWLQWPMFGGCILLAYATVKFLKVVFT